MKICPECSAEYQKTPRLEERGRFNVKYIYSFECAECHTVWEVEHSTERKPLKPIIKTIFKWLLNPITVFLVSSLAVVFIDMYSEVEDGLDMTLVLIAVAGSMLVWGLLFDEQ